MRSSSTGETGVQLADTRKTTPTAPALTKGLDIIELLAARGRPMALREVAEALGRSKNELFRMVHVLIERGYVVREGAEGLVLTNKLFEIGLRTPRNRDLVALATPMIQALAGELGQSVHLIVANRGETVVIASASGNPDVTFSLKLGYRRPLATSHSGLVLLAFQSEDRRERLYAIGVGRTTAAPRREAVERELEAIRNDGYVIRSSRDVVGVTDIIAPVVLRTGEAIATLAVSYLGRRDTARPQHEDVVRPLVRVCRELAEQLGTGSATA
jgi:DNA-binding IclR family transcriptional regulator